MTSRFASASRRFLFSPPSGRYLKRDARFPRARFLPGFNRANETPTVLSCYTRAISPDSFVRSHSHFETVSKSLFLILCFSLRPPPSSPTAARA